MGNFRGINPWNREWGIVSGNNNTWNVDYPWTTRGITRGIPWGIYISGSIVRTFEITEIGVQLQC